MAQTLKPAPCMQIDKIAQWRRLAAGQADGQAVQAAQMVALCIRAGHPHFHLVTGDLDDLHDLAFKAGAQLFADVGTVTDDTPEPAVWQGGAIIDRRTLEQTHLALGFDGVTIHDPDFITAQVVSNVLGGGMSSRLFQEVREKRGLAYSVFSFAGAMADGGMVGVYAASAPDSVAELGPVLAGEIRRLAEDTNEVETARARAQMKAGLVMSLESSSARLEQIARQVLVHGRPLETADLLARVDAVDVATCRRVAEKLFNSGKPMAIAAVGDTEQLASPEAFAAHFV